MRFGSVHLPDRLQPGHGLELSEADVGRVLDAQATRSMILNRAGYMVVTDSIEPFQVPMRGNHYCSSVVP